VNSTLFLRIASIVSLLFAAGHTLGGTESWSPAGETQVLGAMRSFRFDAEGVSRTYLDFYLGFGFIISVYLLLQAVLLWQLATMAKMDSAHVRPLVVSLFLASLASGVLSWRFIFAVPVIFSAVIAGCLGTAFLVSRPASPRVRP
jgi:hypothetical protein